MVVLPCRPLPPRTYLHTNRDATPPLATPRCRMDVLAPASGPLAFLPVDHGLGTDNGLHPMGVISSGRWNVPSGKASDACGGLASPSAPQLPSRSGPACLGIRLLLSGAADRPSGDRRGSWAPPLELLTTDPDRR